MIVKKQNERVYFQFPNLAVFKRLRHGVFTRLGGISEPPFDSLNTSFSENDDRFSIESNRSMISDCVNAGDLVFAKQTHGADILVFTEAKTAEPSEYVPEEGDAMITNLAKTVLTIQTADCQAVLLYDPVRHVAANIHSGWRGSVANIAGKTVRTMIEQFGCDPKYMSAGIGPSLGPCCAEFVNFKTELPESFVKYKGNGENFDFWRATQDQLETAGLKSKNIFSGGICTRCNTHLFYSYRKEHRTGRFASVIGLV